MTDVRTASDVINDLFTNVQKGKEVVIDTVRKVIDGKENLEFHFGNREIQPEMPKQPDRKESPRRQHCFHDAASLEIYLKKYKTAETVVYADTIEERVYVVIDEKAITGFEIITMKPQMHPLFTPWENIIKKGYIEVQKFADLLKENRRSIVEPLVKELLYTLGQIKVSKNLTLQKGFGKHSVNGIVCEIDITGKGNTENQQVEIPDTIVIEVPIYLATEPVTLELDITIDVDDDNDIVAKVTSPDLATMKVKAFESMLEKVKAIDGVTVTLGRPDHIDWARVK